MELKATVLLICNICGYIVPHSKNVNRERSGGRGTVLSSERERGHHPEHRKEKHSSEKDLL